MAATDKDKILPHASFIMDLPQPPLQKAEDYLKAYVGYQYTAIKAIAQDVASIDLHLFEVKRAAKGQTVTNEIFEHEALSVLSFVNELMTFYELIFATEVYKELIGEAFWVVLRENGDKGNPVEIWPVRPDWIKVIPDADGDNVVKEYKYLPGGNQGEEVTIPRGNVIHFKNFNPTNPFRGRGAIQAGAMPIDIFTFMQEWNRNFFFNSATPGMVIKTDKKMSKEAAERFKSDWHNKFNGKSKSHKAVFLSGANWTIDTISGNMKELDFANQQKLMRDDILAIFQVPKSVIGITEDVNRANAEASNRNFLERVITPRMTSLTGDLQEHFLPMFDDGEDKMLDYTDPAPEDVELKLKVYANARMFTWMTPNEIRVQENLEPVEGGDNLFVPVGRGAAPTGNPDEEPGGDEDPEEPGEIEEDEEEEKGFFKGFRELLTRANKNKPYKAPAYLQKRKPKFKHMMPIPAKALVVMRKEKRVAKFKEVEKTIAKDLKKLFGLLMAKDKMEKTKKKKTHEEIWTEEAKVAYWEAFIKQVDAWEAEYKATLIALFNEQEHEVLDSLEDVKFWNKAYRKARLSEILFDVVAWAGRFSAAVGPFIREVILEKGQQVLNTLNDNNRGFNGDTDSIGDYLAINEQMLTDINAFTRSELERTLRIGFDAGDSIPQLRERVQAVFSNATKVRAEMIARTETIRAANLATEEAFKQSEVVVAKEWLTQRDNRVCPWCQSMEDEFGNGKILPLGGNFFKEGESLTVDERTLDFNFDVPRPPLHPNCRCTIISVLKESKQFVPEKEYVKMEKKDMDALLGDMQNKAEAMGREAVEKAEVRAQKILEEANARVEKKTKVTGKRSKKIMRQTKQDSEKILSDAHGEAETIIKQATDDHDAIIEKSKTLAKKEKFNVLNEIKRLRDKAREVLHGQD